MWESQISRYDICRRMQTTPIIEWLVLVVKLAVRVLAKQSLAHSWQGALSEQVQPSLKCVVQINLAVPPNNDHTASAGLDR